SLTRGAFRGLCCSRRGGVGTTVVRQLREPEGGPEHEQHRGRDAAGPPAERAVGTRAVADSLERTSDGSIALPGRWRWHRCADCDTHASERRQSCRARLAAVEVVAKLAIRLRALFMASGAGPARLVPSGAARGLPVAFGPQRSGLGTD